MPPSNVTRITRAIRHLSSDGISQIVYYAAGIGSTGTFGNKVLGGGLGAGLADYVREAYGFLANNYANGDEIFLIGFSRGAFTARSVAGLIGDLGVLTKAGLASFAIVYKVHLSLIMYFASMGSVFLGLCQQVQTQLQESASRHTIPRQTKLPKPCVSA